MSYIKNKNGMIYEGSAAQLAESIQYGGQELSEKEWNEHLYPNVVSTQDPQVNEPATPVVTPTVTDISFPSNPVEATVEPAPVPAPKVEKSLANMNKAELTDKLAEVNPEFEIVDSHTKAEIITEINNAIAEKELETN